jgi:predicted O-linked N-acetylglucosamine transferase (SPINDLY family)
MMREDYTHWFTRGRVHQEAGHPIEAMMCYQRALQSNAHAVRARFRLGEVLHELGRNAEARAAWHAGLDLNPAHLPMLLALADAARRTGAYDEAIAAYRGVLAARPGHPEAMLGFALCGLAQGNETGYAELAKLLGAKATPWFWDELSRTLAVARPSPARTSLLLEIASARVDAMPPLMLACAAEEMIATGDTERARQMLVRAESQASLLDDPETLRRLALVAARVGSPLAWAERYAQRCIALSAGGLSLQWPRRTAGTALRVAYLVAPGTRLNIDGVAIDTETYLRVIVATHARERIAATVCVVGEAPLTVVSALLPPEIPAATLGTVPDAALARSLAEADADALVDLVGFGAAIGPLLAQRPARTLWTYPGLAGANVAPLVTHALPTPSGGDVAALAKHRTALELALMNTCTAAPWFADVAPRTAAELGVTWRAAVAAHHGGDLDAALAGYRDVLGEQPAYAPGQYLLGTLLRDRGRRAEAGRALVAAIEAAPAYVDARVALADLLREERLTGRAVAVCEEGLRHTPNEVSLWRALGLARLAQREGAPARRAFRRALALAPTHAMTHYNEGVALQMSSPGLRDANRRSRNGKLALRAYQRALALDAQLVAADFNIGIIFREQGRPDRAIAAFERVLARDPQHVPAHKALADTLQDERRLDAWFKAFDRFESACPNAFPLLVMALEVCHYRADFAALDRYLNRLRQDEFKPSSETELADCLEELLFLLAYFDFELEAQFGLYKAYNVIAPRVYGAPIALPEERRPGRVRIGYLSGDLRNHVMGKMMWPALERHDRESFELFFYSLSTVSDEWTERYRGLADRFEVIAELSERDAAERIAADDIDILVDLSTHTRSSKPGILALKPARVQITHVASAGVVGLSTIDFKLTDAYADLPESQAVQLETLLPMRGCVYPYRHIPPAADHPFHRDGLEIAPNAVVIGAFVNPLKLSRRCLVLWREVLERIPNAVLAISPMSPERRVVYGHLLSAAGIPDARVRVLPQGRDEAENQARYGLVDFALDPMPYGGANGTLEALDMNVPVVTLVGRKHGERSTYSILANLGVTQTVATSGSEYVEIAVRLATNAVFKAQVSAAICAGLQRSPLTDMDAHTRRLEQAYLQALEQRYPAALAAVRNGSSSNVVHSD